MLLTVFFVCQHNVSSRRVTCSPQVFKDIVGLIRRPEAFVLFTLVLVFGMFMGVISTFLFWYLKLLGDVPQILFGLCILCSCSMEVFVLFFSDRVFRLISQVNCFSIACVVYAIRLASYSVIRNPWMVLLVEPLHAITFGLMYSAASTYVSSITPPGAHGSVQNIIASLHFCYGKSFGALLGGVLFERYGGAATFRMFAVSSLVLLVLHLIAQKFWVKGGRTVNVIEMEVKREQLSTEPGDDEYITKKMTAPGQESLRDNDETKYEETVYDGLV
ncbi:Major facilitator superfamily domain-containing protein 6 [Lamellibrachia satsuma]|nr:Major facilitator superfamily domain-containing protein 6 [Lamellibrachia satsuma]